MKLLLDTNRLSDVLAGVTEVLSVVEGATEVHVPVIVLGEIRCGFLRGAQRAKNEERLRWFLSRDTVHVASVTSVTSQFYATISADLRKRGTPIPTNALWIAALTLECDLAIYTRDQHFGKVQGLVVV